MPELNMLENFNSDHAFWDILVNYLSVKDIQALKVTCRLFNGQLDKMDVAWQPYLNELHAIDDTIRVTPEQGKTIRERFIVGLEKVRTRQLAEIAYLQEKHGENCFAVFSPHIKAALESKEPLRLHDVVAISKELDTFNRGLIEPDIIRARNVGIWLSLQGKGISRIPQALFDYSLYAAFWSRLQIFDFSDNFVQSLPRNFGERLQSLQNLNCDNNQLEKLPESIGNLTSLRQLSLENNQLTVLPTTLDRSVVGGMHNQNPQPGSASDEVTKKRVMDDGNNAKRQKTSESEDDDMDFEPALRSSMKRRDNP